MVWMLNVYTRIVSPLTYAPWSIQCIVYVHCNVPVTKLTVQRQYVYVQRMTVDLKRTVWVAQKGMHCNYIQSTIIWLKSWQRNNENVHIHTHANQKNKVDNGWIRNRDSNLQYRLWWSLHWEFKCPLTKPISNLI